MIRVLTILLFVAVLTACDSTEPEISTQPVRLNQPYVAEWSGSYTFNTTTYETDYFLYVDFVEEPPGPENEGGTLRISDAVDDFGRPSSFLGITSLGGGGMSTGFWHIEPKSFSGSKEPPDDDEAQVHFSGDLLYSPGITISTITFEGVQSLADSLIVGTLTCEPSLRGCESAIVTLRPYYE